MNEKSGAIGAESVVKRGKRTSGGVSAGLPDIYFAEILGFATLRPRWQKVLSTIWTRPGALPIDPKAYVFDGQT